MAFSSLSGRRATAPLLSLLSLLLVLTACSVDEDDLGDGAAEPATADLTAPSQLALEDDEPGDGTLRLALDRPQSLLPTEISLSDQAAVIATDLMFDGLTEAVGTSGTLRPALATEWSVDENVQIWRFSIDTARIDATTVADSFEALLEAPESSLAQVALAHVLTVAADGDDVVFTLDRPDAGLPWLLSGVPFSVVGPEGDSTGRYDIADFADELRFEGDAPVVIEWVDSPEAAYQQLVLGAVDGAVVDADDLAAASSRFGVRSVASTASRFYALNGRSAAISVPEVRDAVFGAIRRQDVTTALAGDAVEADGVAGPSVAGYRLGACGDRCVADVEGAARTVAVLSTPVELTVGYVSTRHEAAALEVSNHLAEVGFSVVVSRYSSAELVAGIEDGSVDIFAAGWVAPATSLDAVIPMLLRAGSPTNIARASSDRIEELLDAAALELDDRTRWDILNDAQAEAIDQALLLPIAVGKSQLVQNPGVDGVTVRADGSLDLSGRD